MNFFAILFFLSFSLSFSLSALQWQTDYDKVVALSRQDEKPILLFFNGSDWSGEAMWMKREVLDTLAFEQKIAHRFLCMEIDFPEHTALSEKKMAQNQELKKRFHVQETPTLLLLDSQERVIAQIGYLPESGEQFADDLVHILGQDGQLIEGMKNLSSDPAALKKLYQIAQELARQKEQESILDAGLKTEDSFFFLEKYRLLVERGEGQKKSTQQLREKITSLDPDNQLTLHFTLALIDFQDLSQKPIPADEAVRPLLDYLDHFGLKDDQNVWRIEMMIAQHYMEADLMQKALLHAEKALQTAPSTMHDEIAHSLNYIRSTTAR